MAERFDRNRAGIVTAVLLAVLLLATATRILPWLTQPRDVISSTPVRTEFYAKQTVVLRTGHRACIDEVPLDPRARVAQVRIAHAATSETRLSLETAGAGYRATTVARIRPQRLGALDIPFPPPRRGVIGVLCLRNTGQHAIRLAGTEEPWALTHSTMTVDGEPRTQAFSLTLLEARRRSLLARVPQLVDRAAALSAVGPWLFWLLIPLLVLGMPACVIAALRLALREPDPASRAD